MNPVEFVSAGAGSGKTYRLTQIISDALAAGDARPHAIVATTFTVKAATELRERARSKLLDAGRLDLASAVGQARIGTINSVCGNLLTRFCFEVGMSPDQTVLSESQALALLTETLDLVLDDDSRSELMDLGRRLAFDEAKWAKPIAAVVKAARENEISGDALRAMGPANADAMLANWPKPREGDHTGALVAAIRQAADAVEARIEQLTAEGAKVFANMTKGLEELRVRQRDFANGSWTWQSWVSTGGVDVGAKLVHLLAPIEDAVKAHEVHPQFHTDVRRYLELVFGLAADTLDSYAQVKLARGALDFVDQEVLLLSALRDSPEVREALAGELDLVVVDEFQDTSPLQLALFVELAKLAKKSVWVGDPKQAIYAFRGTDSTLVTKIIEAIEGWGGELGEPLTVSRRSTPALVSLTNAVFGSAFEPDIKSEAVRLDPSRENLGATHVSLYNWLFPSRNAGTDHDEVGRAIAELLASGQQVVDKETKVARALAAGDIAVLCRTNKEIDRAVASLSRWGVPSASGRAGLLRTPEALFVVACLRRLQDATDTVASALIIALSGGNDPADWLNNRIDFLATGAKPSEWQLAGESAHPLLLRLAELRPRLKALTPSEAMRLAKAESHVAELASCWSHGAQDAGMRIANVEALVDMAKTYEDECTSAKKPATVGGLLQWLQHQASEGGDSRAVAAEGAVTVLTHHGAKGLEWPVVVLTSLDWEARTALWEVRARSKNFDAQQPLRDRFIHFWPYPYGKCSPPEAALAAQASDTGLAMAKSGRDENMRLFYVSMTRARDAVVLAYTTRKGALAWVEEVGAAGVLIGQSGPLTLPDGSQIQRVSRAWSADECKVQPEARAPQTLNWFRRDTVRGPLPLWVNPSSAHAGMPYRRGELERVGERIHIRAAVDMEALGQALHLCIAQAGANSTISLEGVELILQRWGVAGAVEKEAVLAQVSAFQGWVAQRWPGRPVHVEVPIEVNLPNGTRLRGRIDFLVDTPEGWVLIDHKANPRGAAADDALVLKHGRQLGFYADALVEATGRPVAGQWLFLPVAAQAVEVLEGGLQLAQVA
ncbi:ATP-dependent helicase/nuclease subunit A [Variovorax sp. OAS795]|uniref:UvrD-helicase domain-containing protein n=1 Tax=Variovorax sp. OAS795 TaxID=3034231 RepID=UPI003390DEB3